MQEKWNVRLQPIILFLNTQRHLQAVKVSLVQLIPLLISMGLITLLQVLFDFHQIPNISLMIMRLIPFFMAYQIGVSLCEHAKLPSVPGGMLCVGVCFLNQGNQTIGDPMSIYFAWIVCSLIIGELYCQCSRIKWTINSIPSAVNEYLVQLLPYVITIGVGGVMAVFAPSWMPFVQTTCITIAAGFDHILVVMLLIFLTCFFWMLGLHGVASISTITRPIWMYMLLANCSAFFLNQPLPYITGEGFYQWFVWIGGSGATLGLVVMMRCFARSEHLKGIAKQTLIGSCFNINEMVIFGTPVVMNKLMMIPFLFASLSSGVLCYWLIQSGFMTPIALTMAWVLPAPLGAYLASGMQVQAILATLLVFALTCGIYLPFLLKYDRDIWKKEKEQ